LKNLRFGTNNVGILDNYFEVASTSSPPLWSSAIVVKKAALRNIGNFPIGVTSGEDLITWAKLAVNNKIAYSIQPLSTYVLELANGFNDKPKRMLDFNDVVGRELEDLLRENPKTKALSKYLSHWYDMRASVALRASNKKDASIEILKSIRKNPLSIKPYVFLMLLMLPVNSFFIVKKIQYYLR
jgi:hypothetical protein